MTLNLIMKLRTMKIFSIHDSTSLKINYVWSNCFLKMTEPEIQFLNEFLYLFNNEIDEQIKKREIRDQIERGQFENV